MTKSRWGRGAMISRMVSLMVCLSGTRWWTLTELAEASGSNVWSVRRDLKAFEDAGVPIEYGPEAVRTSTGNRYRLATDWAAKFMKSATRSGGGRLPFDVAVSKAVQPKKKRPARKKKSAKAKPKPSAASTAAG